MGSTIVPALSPLAYFEPTKQHRPRFGWTRLRRRPCQQPGFKQGIKIGSAKDGSVTAFIPEPSAEVGAPEGVGVDDAGNVYAAIRRR